MTKKKTFNLFFLLYFYCFYCILPDFKENHPIGFPRLHHIYCITILPKNTDIIFVCSALECWCTCLGFTAPTCHHHFWISTFERQLPDTAIPEKSLKLKKKKKTDKINIRTAAVIFYYSRFTWPWPQCSCKQMTLWYNYRTSKLIYSTVAFTASLCS